MPKIYCITINHIVGALVIISLKGKVLIKERAQGIDGQDHVTRRARGQGHATRRGHPQEAAKGQALVHARSKDQNQVKFINLTLEKHL